MRVLYGMPPMYQETRIPVEPVPDFKPEPIEDPAPEVAVKLRAIDAFRIAAEAIDPLPEDERRRIIRALDHLYGEVSGLPSGDTKVKP